MFKRQRNARKKAKNISSLTDQRIRDLTDQLNNYFKDSTQSTNILKAIFDDYHPSSTVHETILSIYSNSLQKPTLNKFLDKSIDCLHLNDDVQSNQFPNSTENCQLIHHAISKDYENIFRLLLISGFNPNDLLSDCKTPLSIAVVAGNLDQIKRLNYIRLLIEHGANPILRDVNNVSPFKRLCGMESNYPTIYIYFRDYLYSVHPDQVQTELNAGLENALFNWCVPIVTDLLEHGAILDAFQSIDSLHTFFSQIASTFFQERRSISYINPFVLCLHQILLHQIPCVNYSLCIEKFFELIYIPGVCFEANNDPFTYPSMANMKIFLTLSFHYGYLTRQSIHNIRTNHFSKIITAPIQNTLVTQTIRQNLLDTLNLHVDELIVKYQQSPVSLTLLTTRKIRQLMKSVIHKNLEQLSINQHLTKKILLPL
ncbi:hypothetical protein I4U23_014811 [Adineta vaga]|nr:hypothetical protein I4U23_014811 [Adineta vaga]